MQNLKNYTVTYFDVYGNVAQQPVRARSDVDAVAVAVATCSGLRALAEARLGQDRVAIAGAYIALQVFADEREGKVIWTNALFDDLRRSSGAGRGYGV